MCDPTYAPSGAGWNGATTSALAGAPLSGQWFGAQFDQLVTNAYPAITGGPTPPPATPTSTVNPSATPTVKPTATPTVKPSGTISPTATPTIAPTGQPGGCTASWHTDNSWTGGFQATVTITAGSSAITGWTANWTWPSGQSITNSWNAAITTSGSSVSAANMSYNGALAGGANTTFGLQGNGNAVTPSLSCTANGAPPATPTPTVAPTVTPTVAPTATPTVAPTATPTVKPTATPTVAPTGSKGCSASWHTDSAWGGGFTTTVTVTAGSSAISAWTVKWTWPSGQSIASLWNANVSTSGSAVTATSMSYNGAIAAGGNTTFGLQGNGNAPTPTLTCTAS
jgi:cellulase/cellobiase CelA1